MENINHKNFFLNAQKEKEVVAEEPEVVEEVEEVPEEPEEEVVEEKSEEDFYALNKGEQVDRLKELGLTTKEIKALKHEEDRVEKLLELSR